MRKILKVKFPEAVNQRNGKRADQAQKVLTKRQRGSAACSTTACKR
jgi:hypothetical protein